MVGDLFFFDGVWIVDVCDKVICYMDLCLIFYLLVVYFVDCFGFVCGVKYEIVGVMCKGVCVMVVVY